ncbi:MAG: response regulator [Pseudanabaenaceae cyanobacterium]
MSALRKVLVIDDSRTIRNMVKGMLPTTNFEVLEAADGVSGFAAVERERPWLIMLDFILPKMSGYEVYENIRKNRELYRIPLVLMSGKKEEVTSKIPEPLESHYLVFIEKPFDKDKLAAAIKKAYDLANQIPNDYLPAEPVPAAAANGATPVLDPALLARIEELELKLHHTEELEKRLKTLEQQAAIQTKQIQQLVAFIKQKLGG